MGALGRRREGWDSSEETEGGASNSLLRDVDFYYATGLTPRQARDEPLKFIRTLLIASEESAASQKSQDEGVKEKLRRLGWSE